MSCNCFHCNVPGYRNTPLETLLMLRNDLIAIIESLEKKDIRNTLDHYKNRLEQIQSTIDNYNPMEGNLS